MSPSDIEYHAPSVDHHFKSLPYDISQNDLGLFEDLYYAACAELKDLLQQADTFLNNGFKQLDDVHFQFRSNQLRSIGPVEWGQSRALLLKQQNLLMGEELVRPLNGGIRAQRAYQAPQLTQNEQKKFTSSCQHRGLYASDYTHTSRADSCSGSATNNTTCVRDVVSMSSGMISAFLTEKHRRFGTNFDTNLIEDHGSIPSPTPSPTLSAHPAPYISPYNLDERARRLNAPEGPEFPCICDPECICAPLCASDPTQNCLCEENGLFVRVTGGMNIDDLDVPDLVRRPDPLTDSSDNGSESNYETSSSVSVVDDCETSDSESDVDSFDWTTGFHHQRIRQSANISGDFDFSGSQKASMTHRGDTLHGPVAQPRYNAVHLQMASELNFPLLPPAAYRPEDLRRPISEACDTPPRRPRSIVARRLFGGRSAKKN